MEIQGRIQNGVVVFDDSVSLPEGAAVTVVLRIKPVIHVSPAPNRVKFPLILSASPASVDLTNERIAEILDQEDAEAVISAWNSTS